MTSGAFHALLRQCTDTLINARGVDGVWTGELSSSALSTATAVFTLNLYYEFFTREGSETASTAFDAVTEKKCARGVNDGMAWLALHQNADGGWGDTILSLSNVSTTALCWAALSADSPHTPAYANVVAAAEKWLATHCGGLDRSSLVRAIVKRYGADHTFSVPILSMCALAGRLGSEREAWSSVPRLPFELAAFPQRWFKLLRLPVVSYALPALIAIGLVRQVKRPGYNFLTRASRWLATPRVLRLLRRIQPTTGGYLEATPLTSFVAMSLIGAGHPGHAVTANAVQFLLRSRRDDGSWPIDTNLATWLTTLSVNALAAGGEGVKALPPSEGEQIRRWLLDQQYRAEHPYTLADAGGWAWTPLSGGVPDADDTPGALLALKSLGPVDDRTKQAAAMGIEWLLNLQNRDGGIPTFCRGWTNLPFDRSSSDLTAHTLRALGTWIDVLPTKLADSAKRAAEKMVRFLIAAQRGDGAWLALWFGNQHACDDVNPTYGTAKVLLAAGAVRELGMRTPDWSRSTSLAADWLLAAQNADGGWGAGADTPSSIEETALAVESLATRFSQSLVEQREPHGERARGPLLRGIGWLARATDGGTRFEPTPIGFYFAKLWYFEQLYPLIFTTAALHAVAAINPQLFPDNP